MPGFDFAEAGALEFGIRGSVLDDSAKAVEVAVGVFEVRLNAKTEKTISQAAEIEFGLKMLFAHAGQKDTFDGAELAEPFEPFERAPAAGAEEGHDFVEIEWPLGGEKQTVDLADGSRQRESASRADEERNRLVLERVQSGIGRLRQCGPGGFT